MADRNKNTVKDGGQRIANGAAHPADRVKDDGAGHVPMSAANMNDIKPHMEVISSCGCKMGTVDHMEGGAIKLTKNDSPDGQHHFIPTGWVARVDEHVHLNKDADVTKREWKNDAAACAAC